ncbi:3-hydroxyisobutyrate dehydrogenase-like beta-hydroxyacid dehydrogenase [Murinocardiopsis flavida]|uniref:3-hydroxyisobutyrate dehydrogenase-like beta-hydroxyacid dehydrogenase n=1 Tax=Murinocardiopsis flavida TaxID=645275 RepID=A0A2P8DNH5_9ACTN|nr:NAD(P)-binding domain-containing protein [Murinocardiopsis flavida]PSK98781.1 3-hydroxyisobutyrate dehydrogenase-like beta-hydroxyacid dehydrogenase [Murinocardiopsis flavida]
MTDRTAVTVIGLGAMGTALADALLGNGHPTTVWNRTAAKADPLVAKGATRADTAADAVAASPVVVLCVLDDASVRAVLAAAPGALAGRTVVNLTNGTPQQARATAAWAADQGARYLDGGIMAVPPMIGGPGAFILYSGPREVFEEHQGLLAALGAATYVGEDPGLASLQDLALLSAMYGMFGGFEHALSMVAAQQVPAVEFAPLAASWLEAMLAGLPGIAEGFDAGTADNDESNLAMQAVALDNIIDASADSGVDPELMRLLRARMLRGAAR